MSKKNIFIKHSDIREDISGKITYTNILETIPDGSTDNPIEGGEAEGKTEWRWRILEIPTHKDNYRKTVEISYLKPGSDRRMYFNKYGQWVHRDVDSVYDQFVVKKFYYYSK